MLCAYSNQEVQVEIATYSKRMRGNYYSILILKTKTSLTKPNQRKTEIKTMIWKMKCRVLSIPFSWTNTQFVKTTHCSCCLQKRVCLKYSLMSYSYSCYRCSNCLTILTLELVITPWVQIALQTTCISTWCLQITCSSRLLGKVYSPLKMLRRDCSSEAAWSTEQKMKSTCTTVA